MKNNNIPKIIQDFEKEFGNLIWSHEFDYVISGIRFKTCTSYI